ncbi:hypothetical protein P3T40_008968, partial [Paraburkholderia sp. EB58]
RAPRAAGLAGGQAVQWTDHLAQEISGNLGIE